MISEGGVPPGGFFSCQQLLGVLGKGLQQAPLEIFLRYFRNQELKQKIKYAVDQVSEEAQDQQSASFLPK